MTQVLGLATCFNRKEKTVKAIRQLVEGNPAVSFAFVITDDGSTDGTAEALEALAAELQVEIRVLHGSGNLFYTGGMIRAMKDVLAGGEAEGKRVLLFNDDVEFVPGAIENLLAKSPDGIIWVGPTTEADGRTLSYGGVKYISRIRPKFKIVTADTPEGIAVDTFNANCVLLPEGALEAIGPMDPVYHHSLGDFDYGFTAGRKGYEIRVSDKPVGICPDNPQTGTWRDASLPRRERVKRKESIKGVPFKEWWHYLYKNFNVATACFYSATPYIRILIGK